MMGNIWIRRLVIVAALALTFFLGFALRGGSPPDHAHDATSDAQIWTCSMHPQIQLPEFGACPICGMDLIPLETSAGDAVGARSVSLSAAAAELAEVRTTRVARRAVEATLRMVGKLEPDETRVREISAYVSGRIDKLYIDSTGVSVRAGQKLFDLYSPELYSAQEELLQAIRAAEDLSRSGLESTRRSATRTIDAARERLRLWGLAPGQIEAIEKREAPTDHVTIFAPMSGVVLHKDAVEGSYVDTGKHVYAIADLSMLWLQIDVYESDLSWIELGQRVEFETDAYRGERFEGTVSFIDPVLDERSRSVKARVNVRNADGRLKPGMFARAVVYAEIRANGDGLPLVIPATAPLVTGTRAVVYVADPHEKGQYHGREVVLGRRAGDFYVVLEGLSEGEEVVSHGAFKLDSALQILGKTSMMTPEEDHADHEHGSRAQALPTVERIEGVPAAFRQQLDAVLAAYFDLSGALSSDDLEATRAAARLLPVAMESVDGSGLPPTGRETWNQAREVLEAAASKLAAADTIDAARGVFYDVSVQMRDTVRTLGASGRFPVMVFHCPMAMDGDGADWLQTKTETRNPYYGSQMLECGAQAEVLVAGAQ